jgi:hypothetical protein
VRYSGQFPGLFELFGGHNSVSDVFTKDKTLSQKVLRALAISFLALVFSVQVVPNAMVTGLPLSICPQVAATVKGIETVGSNAALETLEI